MKDRRKFVRMGNLAEVFHLVVRIVMAGSGTREVVTACGRRLYIPSWVISNIGVPHRHIPLGCRVCKSCRVTADYRLGTKGRS